MNWREHLSTTGIALRSWFVAQCYDSALVSLMWLAGLIVIGFGIPFAIVWALLAGLLQFIPNLGAVLALIGPALTGLFSSDSMRFVYVLILFAAIMVIDGLLLQPYLMKRKAKVPFWASITAPIILGLIFSFWGVLLAPPLLAVIYAYKKGRPEFYESRGG
ncbi:MAG TPA: AI-2E family transporter [Candidatus Angelobacter sp.]|nr:AI-2E family transporter [Candidatus Angelobacter sp.]